MKDPNDSDGTPPRFWRVVFGPILDSLRTFLGMTTLELPLRSRTESATLLRHTRPGPIS